MKGGYRSLVSSVAMLIENGRVAAGRAINHAMTASYWMVGQRIVEFEQRGKKRAGYGEQVIIRLSDDLTERFGRGFSARNLEQMRLFHLGWPIPQTVSAKSKKQVAGKIPQTVSAELVRPERVSFPLPWSHYVRLLTVRDPDARKYYEAEAMRGGWPVRQLDRQIASLAYQRTRGKRGLPKAADEPEDGSRTVAVTPSG